MEPTKEDYATKSVDDPTCDVMVFFRQTKVGNRTVAESKPREEGIKRDS